MTSSETLSSLTNNEKSKQEKKETIDNNKKEELNEETNEEKNVDDLIDMTTFDQLLDMDDEDDHEFSYSIVLNYFEQAEATFKDMDKALKNKDLKELSQLGHFLKGSSAAIGLKKVKSTCEKIQIVGNSPTEKDENALKDIGTLLSQVKTENSEAEEYLKKFYDVQNAR
ncbi:hypothetical protein G6F62_010964 [Rhizopus arrhizus]|uniref:HPt domain-containing protein n=1 Tax=Rhizopus oryzae TaxID=64495 RepID=A0A9P6X4K9_RHIOR|nr:hypothetical protein G6F23_011658 [Rhizopus arrhizus]KAG0760090.1 hypothetical protein G6F24_008582 [Rhizopus arrhizus]KAG0779187.1 hypothetical protein G6F22_010781 [Rhizopus arrhizus]KAG0786263.1 hypothetical protein G6F21_008712 [Rhizopus arrhizus]KAG0808853.1 hypothetical protein G6F20_009240 [Rhizopus arrhizus]